MQSVLLLGHVSWLYAYIAYDTCAKRTYHSLYAYIGMVAVHGAVDGDGSVSPTASVAKPHEPKMPQKEAFNRAKCHAGRLARGTGRRPDSRPRV